MSEPTARDREEALELAGKHGDMCPEQSGCMCEVWERAALIAQALADRDAEAFARGVESERRACWLTLQRRHWEEQARINELLGFFGMSASSGAVMDACHERDLIGRLRDLIAARGPMAAPKTEEPR